MVVDSCSVIKALDILSWYCLEDCCSCDSEYKAHVRLCLSLSCCWGRKNKHAAFFSCFKIARSSFAAWSFIKLCEEGIFKIPNQHTEPRGDYHNQNTYGKTILIFQFTQYFECLGNMSVALCFRLRPLHSSIAHSWGKCGSYFLV